MNLKADLVLNEETIKLLLLSKEENTYIVDSGASCHMFSSANTEVYQIEKLVSEVKVNFADCSGIVSSEKGTIDFGEFQAEGLVLPINCNLLSTRQLGDFGMVTVFWDKAGAIFNGNGQLVKKLVMKQGIYVIEANASHTCLFGKQRRRRKRVEINVQKEHERLGHLNAASLAKILKRKRIDLHCASCAKGKMTTKHHRRQKHRTLTRPLENLHTDIVHTSTPGIDGELYFLTLLDEATGYIWAKSMRSTTETAEHIKNLITLEIKRVQMDVVKLCRDGGTEFNGLKEFLENHGIEERSSVRYEHDGAAVIEAANRRITDMARCMLVDSNLPRFFWPLAVDYSVLIYNNTNHGKLGTPAELLHGNRTVDHEKFLRFGCKILVHLPKELQRGKFCDHALDAIFLGFDDDGYAYKCYVFSEERILRSRTVHADHDVYAKSELEKLKIFSNADSEEEWIAISDSEEDDYFIPRAEDSCEVNSPVGRKHLTNNDLQGQTGQPTSPAGKEHLENNDRQVHAGPNTSSVGREQDHLVPDDPSLSEALDASSCNALPSQDSLRREKRKVLCSESNGNNKRIRKRAKVRAALTSVTDKEEFIEAETEPRSWKQATQDPKWLASMVTEYDALMELSSWTFVKPDSSKHLFNCLWVFKLKADGRRKARLTINGNRQVSDNTFAGVGSKTALRLMISHAVTLKRKLKSFDISNAFLYGALLPEERVQMRQPEGIPKRYHADGTLLVCLLQKSLYGLRTSPRIWQEVLEKAMQEFGFVKSMVEEGLWYSGKLILWIYVDDLIISYLCDQEINRFEQFLTGLFKIRCLGKPTRIVGIDFLYAEDGQIVLSQELYCKELMQKHNISSNEIVRVPLKDRIENMEPGEVLGALEQKLFQSIIGSILYLVVCTRPDLAFVASVLGKFNKTATTNELGLAQEVLMYINGTQNVGLKFSNNSKWDLIGFSDTDHAAASDRISRYCYTNFIGGHLVSWTSKTIGEVALSSAESELYGSNFCGQELLYLRKLQAEFLLQRSLNSTDELLVPTMFVDNKSCVTLLTSRGYRAMLRHVDIKSQWIISKCISGQINSKWVPGEENPADIGTKPLHRTRLYGLMHMLGLRRFEVQQLEGNAQVVMRNMTTAGI